MLRLKLNAIMTVESLLHLLEVVVLLQLVAVHAHVVALAVAELLALAVQALVGLLLDRTLV